MNFLIDQAMLLLYCLGSLLFVPADISFVTAFFLSVIVCAAVYVMPETPQAFFFVCCFVLTALLLPQLIWFAPLAACFFCYALHSRGIWKKLYLGALACSAVFFFRQAFLLPERAPLFYIFCGIAFALLLSFRTLAYERFAGRSRRLYDSGRERELRLEAENQALVHRQDAEIYAATLEERTRIAREIHDNVGHMITRSILMVGALRSAGQNSADAEPLAQLEGSLNDAMNSIRESVHDLHDASVNLEKTLHTLTEDFSFCPAALRYDIAPDVPPAVCYCMIAVTKEALVNVSRHSSATKVSVTAQEHPAFYQLSIRDNGAQDRPAGPGRRARAEGMEAGSPARPAGAEDLPGGIGLANMQYRVQALNGTMRILREDGFCIHITIPK